MSWSPELTDEVLIETLKAKAEHKSIKRTALALGINRSTLDNRLKRAALRGLDGSTPKALPPGQLVAGTSTLYSGGEQVLQWVKTKSEPSIEDTIAALKEAFDGYKAAKPIKAPAQASEQLLTLTPCNDWHLGLYVWGRECGTNWDLRLAESVIGGAIDDLVERAPSSEVSIVLGGGDAFHADNSQNQTAKSGNALDVDGRYPKIVEVAGRLHVRTVDAHLRKHKRVIVRILPGNHDEHSAVALAYFLLAWYRNEPRVTVDVDPSLFFWHRFGKVFLGATHGHTVKLDKMPGIMASRRPEDWGASRFRYVHGFHIHHLSKVATEGNGCICESHQAPIPQDAWHTGAGFLSGRSLQSITYHRDYGEVSRNRVAIIDAEAA